MAARRHDSTQIPSVTYQHSNNTMRRTFRLHSFSWVFWLQDLYFVAAFQWKFTIEWDFELKMLAQPSSSTDQLVLDIRDPTGIKRSSEIVAQIGYKWFDWMSPECFCFCFPIFCVVRLIAFILHSLQIFMRMKEASEGWQSFHLYCFSIWFVHRISCPKSHRLCRLLCFFCCSVCCLLLFSPVWANNYVKNGIKYARPAVFCVSISEVENDRKWKVYRCIMNRI